MRRRKVAHLNSSVLEIERVFSRPGHRAFVKVLVRLCEDSFAVAQPDRIVFPMAIRWATSAPCTAYIKAAFECDQGNVAPIEILELATRYCTVCWSGRCAFDVAATSA